MNTTKLVQSMNEMTEILAQYRKVEERMCDNMCEFGKALELDLGRREYSVSVYRSCKPGSVDVQIWDESFYPPTKVLVECDLVARRLTKIHEDGCSVVVDRMFDELRQVLFGVE